LRYENSAEFGRPTQLAGVVQLCRAIFLGSLAAVDEPAAG
jgi:hypothetical protein